MKEDYKYVAGMLSQDLVDFLTDFSLQNINEGDIQAPNSSALHSRDSEIYTQILL